jgi:hypothetical protein
VAGFRAALFLVKISTMTIPCVPYAANQWLMYPLFGMAAFDMGLMAFSLRWSLLLLGAHITVVVLASQHSRLCEVGKVISWADL